MSELTITESILSVQGFGTVAVTSTIVTGATIIDTAGFTSLTSSSTSTPSPDAGGSAASSGLSTGARFGIAIAVPLIVSLATVVAVYHLRRRRKRRAQQRRHVDTPFPQERKPELDAGPIDPTIAGPVRAKPELSTNTGTSLLPELYGATIAEADTNDRTTRKGISKRERIATTRSISSRDSSERPLIPVESHAGTTTTLQTDAELIEEADVAVQELGLLAMRKKTLITQAKTLGKRPEQVEGRRGEEYRELVQREEKVRNRLDEIEAERRN